MSFQARPEHIQLGRALYGDYYLFGEGLSASGDPLPTWSELGEQGHDRAGTPMEHRHAMEPNGEQARWCHVACASSWNPTLARARASALYEKYANNEHFQRGVS